MTDCSDISFFVTGFPLDRIVVVDTETTGLSPFDGDEILSIAVCDAFGEMLFSSYIRPTHQKAWPDAESINGISPSMVRNSPTLPEVLPKLRELLHGDKLIVGYNVEFDLNFIVKGGVFPDWSLQRFDVMTEYARVHGTRRTKSGDRYKWSKLDRCAASYGYKFSAHNAAEDAKATAYCFRALLCDDAYLKVAISEAIDELRPFRVSQTKATKSAIVSMVGDSEMLDSDAELRLGAVTRGKNKGAPRYECFINDSRVGISAIDEVEKVRRLYLLNQQGELPQKVACRATLYASDDFVKCEVMITASDDLAKSIRSTAKEQRSLNGFEYRRVKEETKPPESRPHQEKRGVQAGNKNTNSTTGFAVGCLAFILLALAAIAYSVWNWFIGLFS